MKADNVGTTTMPRLGWQARDVQAWLDTLAKTPDGQGRVVRYLLDHACEDGMSADDRKICRRALKMLGHERARPGQRTGHIVVQPSTVDAPRRMFGRKSWVTEANLHG